MFQIFLDILKSSFPYNIILMWWCVETSGSVKATGVWLSKSPSVWVFIRMRSITFKRFESFSFLMGELRVLFKDCICSRRIVCWSRCHVYFSVSWNISFLWWTFWPSWRFLLLILGCTSGVVILSVDRVCRTRS